jgi:nitroreductase
MVNPSVSPKGLLAQLRWRYATKQFDPARTIPPELWHTLEEALILTPSSYGLQPWKFLVVTDTGLRQALRPHSWDQSQITDASHLLVFAQRKNLDAKHIERYINRIAHVRGISASSLEGFKNIMVDFIEKAKHGFDIDQWASHQVYIALGNFLTCAALLGVDACPMEGIDTGKYDQILGLDAKGYHTLCAAAAGYRAPQDPYAAAAKVRFPAEEVIERL